MRHCGEYEEALAIIQDVYDRECKLLGVEHNNTLVRQNILGLLLTDTKNYAEAEKMFRTIVTSFARINGHDQKTLTATNNLALV